MTPHNGHFFTAFKSRVITLCFAPTTTSPLLLLGMNPNKLRILCQDPLCAPKQDQSPSVLCYPPVLSVLSVEGHFCMLISPGPSKLFAAPSLWSATLSRFPVVTVTAIQEALYGNSFRFIPQNVLTSWLRAFISANSRSTK